MRDVLRLPLGYRLLLSLAFAIALALVLLTVDAGEAGADVMDTTFYGGTDGYCGNTMANGEVFDCSGFTAAHPYLPFGTVLEVCLDGCVTVTVTDRCACGLDLSPAAADVIGLTYAGRAPTSVTIL